MSAFKLLPTSIRHLAAQFRPLTQPTVWIPTVIFAVGGLFLWEVSVHPEWLNLDEEEITSSTTTERNIGLSLEDRMIAADIDTVPVLVNQLNRSSASSVLLNSPVLIAKGLFDEVRDRRLETAKPDIAPNSSFTDRYFALPDSEITTVPISGNKNLFNSNSAANLTNSAVGGELAKESASPATGTSVSATNSPNSGKPSPNSLSVSPLQAAMEKYRAANSPPQKTAQTSDVTNSGNSPLKPTANPVLTANQPLFSNPPATTPELFPGFNPSIPSTTLTPQLTSSIPLNSPAPINPLANPYQINQSHNSYLNNQGNNPYQTNLHGSDPIPEVQPITLPTPSSTVPGRESSLPNNFGQSAFPSAIQGSKVINSNSTNSGNLGFPSVSSPSPNFGATSNQVNQTWQPIGPTSEPVSLPRPIPGRYIGGGEINTFANP
ncbi:hypothetical protein [Phormidium nigroviride]